MQKRAKIYTTYRQNNILDNLLCPLLKNKLDFSLTNGNQANEK